MLIKDLKNCAEITAGDATRLRELLHPERDSAAQIRYSLAWAVVKPGAQSLSHRMKTTEVYYILKGTGVMVIDEEEQDVSEGMAIYIPASSKQYLKNNGDCDIEFLCIVDPAWRKEDEIVD